VLAAAGLVVVLAGLGDLEAVAERLEHADTGLVALAAGFEALSFAGYVALTRIVFQPAAPRISWAASLDITLAGVVATRIVTAGGAGGIALTVWALRAAGLDGREVATRLGGFFVVLYGIYFIALAVVGAGLATGLFGREAPASLAMAGFVIGTLVVVLALSALLVPRDLEMRVRRAAVAGGRLMHWAARLVPAPAVVRDGVALALRIVLHRPVAIAAAVVWWGFDVAVLWSTLDMFGAPPAISVLVLCYFLGQLAQVIPVPGGIGPVEGGTIAALAACHVPVSQAVVAVLAYKAIATWLPAVPGALAYLRLRRTVAAWRAAA
jgi:uncharacterized membrane protein YbhN (UPF0104 family)